MFVLFIYCYHDMQDHGRQERPGKFSANCNYSWWAFCSTDWPAPACGKILSSRKRWPVRTAIVIFDLFSCYSYSIFITFLYHIFSQHSIIESQEIFDWRTDFIQLLLLSRLLKDWQITKTRTWGISRYHLCSRCMFFKIRCPS